MDNLTKLTQGLEGAAPQDFGGENTVAQRVAELRTRAAATGGEVHQVPPEHLNSLWRLVDEENAAETGVDRMSAVFAHSKLWSFIGSILPVSIGFASELAAISPLLAYVTVSRNVSAANLRAGHSLVHEFTYAEIAQLVKVDDWASHLGHAARAHVRWTTIVHMVPRVGELIAELRDVAISVAGTRIMLVVPSDPNTN